MAEREVIELDSDSDNDEDLRRAIALSLKDQEKPADADTTADFPRAAPKTQATFGSILLNRKEMEAERLRRLGKRQRSPEDNNVEEEPVKKRPAQKQPRAVVHSQLRYPHGTVRRTWARGYPKTSDDITIEEVFQKEGLQLAVLSSFQWDEEWMLSKLNVHETRILLLAFAADEGQKTMMKENVPKNIRFCFPPMNGPGSMHSKLQILKYSKYIRVVVPTGNLVPYDWGETGVMENMVFIIDLPRLDSNSGEPGTEFGRNLVYFLQASGVDAGMIKSLDNYDFSSTQNLGFVFSIPGGHVGEAKDRVGYCGLGSTVKSLGFATDTPIEVDLVCASLGSINLDLVNAIYNACQGDDGMREYNSRTSRKNKKNTQPDKELRDKFRIYFPSDQTVAKSKGGRRSAGTICVRGEWWESSSFPRELVRDCINNRKGLLMHSKIIFVRMQTSNNLASGNAPGWTYVGSANLSESAWGRLVKDKTTGKTKINCRNWECGVVLPAKNKQGNNCTFEMFASTVPVPMEVPGRRYEANDKPWLFLDAQK